jgi:hypothetical protein
LFGVDFFCFVFEAVFSVDAFNDFDAFMDISGGNADISEDVIMLGTFVGDDVSDASGANYEGIHLEGPFSGSRFGSNKDKRYQ